MWDSYTRVYSIQSYIYANNLKFPINIHLSIIVQINAIILCLCSLCLCRSFSATVGTLPGLDMPGRPVLHSKHHAPVHNFDRSISVIAVSDAIWPQQNEKACNGENYFRMASVDCYESAIESDVFKGNEHGRATTHKT